MAIYISKVVREKLDVKHGGVSLDEIRECFANMDGKLLYDTRSEHLTNPITRWFIAETNYGRELKIAFMQMSGDIHIKTAYEPNEAEREAYEKGNV